MSPSKVVIRPMYMSWHMHITCKLIIKLCSIVILKAGEPELGNWYSNGLPWIKMEKILQSKQKEGRYGWPHQFSQVFWTSRKGWQTEEKTNQHNMLINLETELKPSMIIVKGIEQGDSLKQNSPRWTWRMAMVPSGYGHLPPGDSSSQIFYLSSGWTKWESYKPMLQIVTREYKWILVDVSDKASGLTSRSWHVLVSSKAIIMRYTSCWCGKQFNTNQKDLKKENLKLYIIQKKCGTQDGQNPTGKWQASFRSNSKPKIFILSPGKVLRLSSPQLQVMFVIPSIGKV